MPVYCYRHGDVLIERLVPASQKPPLAVRIPGTKKYAKRSIGDEQGAIDSGKSTGWPMVSRSLYVGPKLVEKAKKEAAQAGIKVDFTPAGEPILKSPKHRRDYLRFRGVVDRDSFY